MHYEIVHHTHQQYKLAVHTWNHKILKKTDPMKFVWLRLPVQHVHPMLLAVLRENYRVRF